VLECLGCNKVGVTTEKDVLTNARRRESQGKEELKIRKGKLKIRESIRIGKQRGRWKGASKSAGEDSHRERVRRLVGERGEP